MLPSYSPRTQWTQEKQLPRQPRWCPRREIHCSSRLGPSRPECLIDVRLADKGRAKKARRAYRARIPPCPPKKNNPNRETLRRALRRPAPRCSEFERKPFSSGRDWGDRSTAERCLAAHVDVSMLPRHSARQFFFEPAPFSRGTAADAREVEESGAQRRASRGKVADGHGTHKRGAHLGKCGTGAQ